MGEGGGPGSLCLGALSATSPAGPVWGCLSRLGCLGLCCGCDLLWARPVLACAWLSGGVGFAACFRRWRGRLRLARGRVFSGGPSGGPQVLGAPSGAPPLLLARLGATGPAAVRPQQCKAVSQFPGREARQHC